MVDVRNTAVLYTTAVCNLKCKYCYIDKNEALKRIDNMLDESFKGDYYISFLKEVFPHRAQLRKIETWGGEPFLRMDRIYHTLHEVIKYYTLFDTMHSSTNFSFPDWNDQFFGLMAQFGEHMDRKFKYSLQLSMDGPEYINDYGRGKGTTAACMKNFDIFLDRLGTNLPSNIDLNIHFKPTLDINSFKMLDSVEKILDYYKPFDEAISRINDLGFTNVHCSVTVPNTASPSQYTKEDGEIFANLCRLCLKAEKINDEEHILKNYKNLTPYGGINHKNMPFTYAQAGFTCGTGKTIVGLLPNRMISTCHNGFVDLISDYKSLCTANKGESTIDFDMFIATRPSKFTMPYEKYQNYEFQMDCYSCKGTTARLASMALSIRMNALAGNILEKYTNEEESLKAALFIQNRCAYCVRSNYNTTGSLTMLEPGIIYLLCNGAIDVIEGRTEGIAE